MQGTSQRQPSPGAARSRPGLRRVVGVAISVVALAGCAWWASRQQAPEIPTSSRALALLAAALAVYAASMVVRGFRWKALLDRAGIELPAFDPYGITLVGYMGNTILPLRGGEALRVLLVHDRSAAGWPASIGSVVPERVLDAASLALLFAVVGLSATVQTPGGDGVALAALAGFAALLATGLAYRTLRRAGRLDRFAERIRPLAAASRPLLTPAGLWLGAVSIAIWLLEGAVFWLIAEALELQVGPLEGLGLAVVAAASSLIPAGPAFAGTFDAAVLIALRALSVTGGAAVSYALLVRLVVFVPVTIAGLALALTRYGGFGALRRRVPPAVAADARQSS